uniref:Uncharacterized protein n=1 Tax=viral metagenome TaxID=1070528 RepID=A0A6C0BJM2_9ZZZZ
MSYLNAFNTKLIEFFQDLSDTYPEEKEIRQALEAITGLKKINPKMIIDLFHEYVYVPLADPIKREDEDFIIPYANKMIAQQFNEMSIALMIFHKYWPEMSTANRKAIWMYLKVLVVFCEKAKNL